MTETHLLILLSPTVVAVVCLLALQPYAAMRVALATARRESGRGLEGRYRTEVRHLRRYALRALVAPLAVLTVIQVALAVALDVVGPGAWLADLFGDFHPEVALHAADVDELLAMAEEARRAQPARPSVLSALLQHWPLWPAYLMAATGGVLYFSAVRLPMLARRYVLGVKKRIPAAAGALADRGGPPRRSRRR